MNQKIVAIVQARMGSTRLPGKVMMDLAGEPVLARVINRAMRAKTLDSVIVATTTKPGDDIIASLCRERGWPLFRGSEDDVLDRYYQAALSYKPDTVVRITSDCPLIEPEIIDDVVNDFLANPQAHYVTNTLTRSFPRGLDVEVMSFAALEKAWQEDHNPAWREHVTVYIYQHPEKFVLRNVVNEIDYSYMRWTVDTVEDMTLVRKIYESFPDDLFTWKEVLKLLQANPEWLKINQEIKQKEL